MSQENKYRAFSDDKIGKNYSEEDLESFPIQQNSTPAELVDALNLLGTSPSDLVAILEALKQAGALKAEMVVI